MLHRVHVMCVPVTRSTRHILCGLFPAGGVSLRCPQNNEVFTAAEIYVFLP